MHIIDWIVLIGILVTIVLYGIWKTRNVNTTESFLKGEQTLPWYTIGLSVMATQASAITFLSTPGQAYEDGMRFAQFYFGLPIAMIILCIYVLPKYYKLKVYTAYEFLENRFDLKTRSLTAVLFLIQRGLAAGLTIFAPSIILSSILGWNLNITNLLIGTLVIVYTVSGGTNAVSQTQKQQMIIILTGMFVAFLILINKLPPDISFGEAVDIAGNMKKLNIVDFKFDLSNRYNIWSALLGGTFLFLSYFGTDQSQVQRYLSGKSLTQSRLGLLFNGIFKVPMQFAILFVGIMVFVFYQFNDAPLHFNKANVEIVEQSSYANDYNDLELKLNTIAEAKRKAIYHVVYNNRDGVDNDDAILKMNETLAQEKELRKEAKELIQTVSKETSLKMETEDSDYVFITFVTEHLPIGLIGLLLAVIFSAAMSSTASELNALATTSLIDIYKRSYVQEATDQHYLKMSKWFTFGWGIMALLFASFATLFDNLIEAVNIIGSLFYGTILGVFAIAFFIKKIKGNATFYGAIIGEIMVLILFYLNETERIELAYLWLNLIGCVLVIIAALLIQIFTKKRIVIVED
ncbi:MAG: sodium:solute symporter [Flavobacteriaceae bacterium]|nr:sodium:solute symporter [Flavobacteriaceae bacterium]